MREWTMVAVIAIGTLVLVTIGLRAVLRGRRVPARAKLAAAGAVIWLLSPVDVIPDFAPAVGVLDDLVVLVAAVRYVLDQLQPADPTEPAVTAEPVADRLRGRRAVQASDWRLSDDRLDRGR